jgi:hypothetical protein
MRTATREVAAVFDITLLAFPERGCREDPLGKEQKAALLQSANNGGFCFAWKADRQMESRAHLARAAAEREQLRCEGRAQP